MALYILKVVFAVFDAFNIQMAYSMFIWLIEIFETISSSLHIMDCKQINLFKALHQSIELSLRIYTHTHTHTPIQLSIKHIAYTRFRQRIETSTYTAVQYHSIFSSKHQCCINVEYLFRLNNLSRLCGK